MTASYPTIEISDFLVNSDSDDLTTYAYSRITLKEKVNPNQFSISREEISFSRVSGFDEKTETKIYMENIGEFMKNFAYDLNSSSATNCTKLGMCK